MNSERGATLKYLFGGRGEVFGNRIRNDRLGLSLPSTQTSSAHGD